LDATKSARAANIRSGRGRTLLRDPGQWQIVIHDHHQGYIKWEEFERNQNQLRNNTAAEADHRGGAVKAGAALLSGLMRCGCCGRMMYVRYRGLRHQFAYYDCMGAAQDGRRGCLSVGARNVDGVVSQALLSALRPTALQAAFEAFEQGTQQDSRKLKALELGLQQARYETQRARRQYDAVEPENRLVCGELEKRWEQALRAEKDAEQAWDEARKKTEQLSQQDRLRLAALAEDLPSVWSHEATSIEVSDLRQSRRLDGGGAAQSRMALRAVVPRSPYHMHPGCSSVFGPSSVPARLPSPDLSEHSQATAVLPHLDTSSSLC
jgi:hypothetical protein